MGRPKKVSDLTFDAGRVLVGDCLARLKDLPDASIDSIVTDPPYEIGFMGKGWDSTGIAYNVELWRECLRVLKPGGHLLAFGATRSYHRMAVAIEDSGFEIRDSIHWVYGSGFPKSLDVSKAIDKRGGSIPWQREFAEHLKQVKPKNITAAQINAHVALNGSKSNFWGHFTDTKSQPLLPTVEQYVRLREIVPIDQEWDEQFLPEAEREVIGKSDSTLLAVAPGEGRDRPPVTLDITAAATDAAKQWEGWGTALKPAHEPIVVARRPLIGTVAANVLAYGTGALNIDGARIGYASEADKNAIAAGVDSIRERGGVVEGSWKNSSDLSGANPAHSAGRWPANIVFTHAADCDGACVPGCPVAELDQQSGVSKSIATQNVVRNGRSGGIMGSDGPLRDGRPEGHNDAGGAARFFTVTEWDPSFDVPFRYVAKPSRRERNAGLDALAPPAAPVHIQQLPTRPAETRNIHPTVKPVALMRWLVRLVTPPGGTVLDPFLGSGTTAVATILEGFAWVGCEMTADYMPIIKGRVTHAEKQKQTEQQKLFNPT